MQRSKFNSDALCDLFLSGMDLYPMAARAGFAYWSELACTAASCYGDVVEAMMMAVRDPRDKDAIAARLATSARAYLAQTGDISERAILGFHQRLNSRLGGRDPSSSPAASDVGDEQLIGTLRGVADAALNEAWKFESPDRRPDLEAVRRRIESALEEIRRAQREGGTPSGSAPAGA